MKDKYFKYCIGFVSAICVVLILYLFCNWFWIKNEAVLQGFLFSLIGAIIGGLLSGYGSYLGGINGAQRNCQLTLSVEKENAKRQLFAHLATTLTLVKKWITLQDPQNKKYVPIIRKKILFNNEWFTQLMIIECLTAEEIEIVLYWFDMLAQLEEAAQRAGELHGETLCIIYKDIKWDEIEKIISKLGRS